MAAAVGPLGPTALALLRPGLVRPQLASRPSCAALEQGAADSKYEARCARPAQDEAARRRRHPPAPSPPAAPGDSGCVRRVTRSWSDRVSAKVEQRMIAHPVDARTVSGPRAQRFVQPTCGAMSRTERPQGAQRVAPPGQEPEHRGHPCAAGPAPAPAAAAPRAPSPARNDRPGVTPCAAPPCAASRVRRTARRTRRSACATARSAPADATPRATRAP